MRFWPNWTPGVKLSPPPKKNEQLHLKHIHIFILALCHNDSPKQDRYCFVLFLAVEPELNIHYLDCWKAYRNRGGGGGVDTQIIFWQRCAAQCLKPLPISKDFPPSKNGWSDGFYERFANQDPNLKGFPPIKGWFYHFSAIFVKWDPFLKIFLTKMGPMSKDFWWKSNPFGRYIPLCLNMKVPPPWTETHLTLPPPSH